MKIVMLTTNDPAGMGINFTNAINRYTEHQCRLITTEQRYGIDFGKDLHVPDLTGEQIDEIGGVLRQADIFHFHMTSDENMKVGPFLVKDFLGGKKILHHHHGHPHFRSNPEHYSEKYRRLKRRVIVSTPDLLKLLPDASWQPNIVPINDPLYLPNNQQQTKGSIVVGQSPTRKDLKNCDELERAVAIVSKCIDIPVEHRSFERMKHNLCLQEKRRCDMIFDHMQGYFGVSSLESLSQGKPVIAGLDEWNVRCLKKIADGFELPWLIAHDVNELSKIIIENCEDRDLLQEVGARSRSFMEKCWSDRRIVRFLEQNYAIL